jgi:hypothetical protein
MQKRYVVGGLAVILAIAVAVPALGVDAGSSASVKKVSKKVKMLAKRVAALEGTDAVPGPQGAGGPQGPEGPQGPIGPSSASTEADGSVGVPDVKAQFQDRATPAGSYLLWAKMDANGDGAPNDLECDLVTTAPDSLQDRATVDIPTGDGTTVDLMGSATTTGGEAALRCTDGGTGVTLNNVRLSVLEVGSLVEE